MKKIILFLAVAVAFTSCKPAPKQYVNGDQVVCDSLVQGRDGSGLVDETPFVAGVIQGEVRNYYNGGKSLMSKAMYVNGTAVGTVITYYESGTVWTENTWVNNMRNGVHKEYWDTTGTLKIEANYVNDLMVGAVKQYFPNGKLGGTSKYRQGEQVGPAHCSDGRTTREVYECIGEED